MKVSPIGCLKSLGLTGGSLTVAVALLLSSGVALADPKAAIDSAKEAAKATEDAQNSVAKQGQTVNADPSAPTLDDEVASGDEGDLDMPEDEAMPDESMDDMPADGKAE